MAATVQTSYVQLKWNTRVLSCKTAKRVLSTCHHTLLHASPFVAILIIIITNLQPLSIDYIFLYSFCRPSEHAKQCREYLDNNLSHAARNKCLNNQKKRSGPTLKHAKECLNHFLILSITNS